MVVGLSGTVIDIALLAFLKQSFGMRTLFANVISYSAGIVNNFYWNRRWTFPETKHNIWKQFAQYASVNLTGLAIDTMLVVALEPLFMPFVPDGAQSTILAKIVSTGIIAVWNFGINRIWTFNDVDG